MTLIELIVFACLCLAIGFVGHLFSARSGWLVGIVPFLAVMALMMFFQVRGIFLALWKTIVRRESK